MPLIGAFSRPKPFLLKVRVGKVPDIGAKAGFGGVFGFGTPGP